MKALLQQVETQLYFKGPEQWTPNPWEAYDFKSSLNARSYCLSHGIPSVQIVLKFEVDKYDIVLPTTYPRTTEDPSGPQISI
ncbi:MAG: hypothetical protein JWQ71_298 [Pedosphaera sp.]|nr:hypothetical protein [Pedosphaera sp.]